MTRSNRAKIFTIICLRFERVPNDSVNMNNSSAMCEATPLAKYKKFNSKLDPIAVSTNAHKNTAKRIGRVRINVSI
jgi:hypothetical protein